MSQLSAASVVLGRSTAELESSIYSLARQAGALLSDCFAKVTSVCNAYFDQSTLWTLLRDMVFLAVLSHYAALVEHEILLFGVRKAVANGFKYCSRRIVCAVLSMPGLSGKAQQELDPVLNKIHSQLVVHPENIPISRTLPSEGLQLAEITNISTQLQTVLKRHKWEDGRVSGTVYHGGDNLAELQSQVYREFSVANQLHPDCFPALREMESEVVSMVLDLFNGPKGSCGTSTSGGTESLLLTCLAAREMAKAERGLQGPFEIVAPRTIHAGFDKAAFYFGMRLIHAPVDPVTGICNVADVEKLITPYTVLLAGSAPNFPHGIIDDIAGLSKLALKHRLPLHVDCCLGSFIVPFLSEVHPSDKVPIFDFRHPGVTSISCDTHKYGFAPKGSSIIMYRTPKLRRYQYFVSADWSGGLYASPTLAGSRPGALMAGCWATMLYFGRRGYAEQAAEIIRAAAAFKAGIEQHPVLSKALRVVGDPICSVVALIGVTINVYDLSDSMSKRGWHLNALQHPPAIHIAFTRPSASRVPELLAELAEAVESTGSTEVADTNTKALYGVAGSVNTAHFAERIAEGFIDCLYEL